MARLRKKRRPVRNRSRMRRTALRRRLPTRSGRRGVRSTRRRVPSRAGRRRAALLKARKRSALQRSRRRRAALLRNRKRRAAILRARRKLVMPKRPKWRGKRPPWWVRYPWWTRPRHTTVYVTPGTDWRREEIWRAEGQKTRPRAALQRSGALRHRRRGGIAKGSPGVARRWVHAQVVNADSPPFSGVAEHAVDPDEAERLWALSESMVANAT